VAHCGLNPVTIAHGGPVLATGSIAVFCPAITVTPNPVDSGGGKTVLNVAGTGFPANRTVDLGFDGQTRTTLTSDASGAVRGTIGGISPACGLHQATATAHPPAGVPAAQAVALGYLPVGASTAVTVVGCARIIANPSVIEQGTLTHVTGVGFLPRTAVTLTWQSPAGHVLAPCSSNAVSVPALAADAAGSIDVFCLAFPHEAVGNLLMAAAQNPEIETTPVVVEEGTMQPSNGDQFVFRR
jgi:hypothetical protein